MSDDNANAAGAARALLATLAIACVLGLAACTPQQALIAALMPTGAIGTALGNLQNVSVENYRQVLEFEKRGDWKGLAAFAEANAAKDRFNPDWLMIQGYARTQLEDHRGAAEAYAAATRAEPENPTAWHLLAQSYRSAGDSPRAIKVLNTAVVSLREPSRTWYLLGESYGDIGRDAEAAAAYREAAKIDPGYAAAWFRLTQVSRKLGRTAEAAEAQAKVEKLDPKLAQRLGAGP